MPGTLPDQAGLERRVREICLRVLTVVDTFSRYAPVLYPRHSYRGEDVVQTLERVCRNVGYPRTISVDQGTEFVSRDLDLWAYAKGVTLDFSRPSTPLVEGRASCRSRVWRTIGMSIPITILRTRWAWKIIRWTRISAWSSS